VNYGDFDVNHGYVMLYDLFEPNYNGLDVYLDELDSSLG